MLARLAPFGIAFGLAPWTLACTSVLTPEPAATGGGATTTTTTTDAGEPPPPPLPDPGVRFSLGKPECLKRADGTVTCWSHLTSDDGAWVAPGIADAVMVTSAIEQGCVLRANRHVWCWGFNHHGQLGTAIPIGDTTPDPVEIPGVELVQLVTGHHAMCGIRASGQAVCWGGAYMGPLGTDPGVWETQAEVEVIGVPDAIDISGSPERMCAVRASGEVWCWVDHALPAKVEGISGAVKVTAGHDSCALLADGAVMCWEGAWSAEPALIAGLEEVVQVSTSTWAGTSWTCARRAAGSVACWQSDGVLVELDVDDAIDLSATCVVRSSGATSCWDATAMQPFPAP